MDPMIVTAIVAGSVGIITGFFTLRATRTTEMTKLHQVEATADLDAVKVKLEGWAELVENLRLENERLERSVSAERVKSERLQIELNECHDGKDA